MQHSLAPDDEIAKNLKRFARQRPDLYDEKKLAQEYEEDANQTVVQKQQIIWDGQSKTLTRTHANVAMMQNQQKQNLIEAEKATLQKRVKK